MGLFRTLRRGAAVVSLGIAGGAIVVTARHLLDTPQPLQSGLLGEGRIDRKHGGDVYYNVAGPANGQPLVLLHDFYSGASNFEFRRIFPQLTDAYRVYAPDWLGFGMSEHPSVAYTGEFYANSLTGFLRDVVAQPAVVVAHGRAANIALRAASDQPALFERLILVSPFISDTPQGEPTLPQTLAHTAQRVSLGLVPYAVLSTRPALRWLSTRRSALAAEGVPSDEAVDHLYASAHQFGGQHALLALLTGGIDLPLWNAFALLEPPALLISGDRDPRHTTTDMEDLAVLNPHAELVVIANAGDTVYEDQPEAFLQNLTRWLASPQQRHVLDEDALLNSTPLPTATAPSSAESTIDDVEDRSEYEAPSQTMPENLSALVSGGILSAESAADEPDPTGETTAPMPPTEEAASVLGPSDTGADEEALTGTPGAVVPGVSDAGQEGLATVVGDDGVATVDETATMPADVSSAGVPSTESATASGSEPDTMLPEAGEAAPTDIAEQEARAGAEPPLAPADNIAQGGAAEAQPPTDSELAEPGDVLGLAETVQTPDEAVATSEDAVATNERGVTTPDSVVATPSDEAEDVDETTGTPTGAKSVPAEAEAEASASATQSATVRPASTHSAQHATRAGSRQSGAHPEPRGRSGASRSSSGSGGARGGGSSGSSARTTREGKSSQKGRSSRSTKK